MALTATLVLAGNEESGFDSGEGALETATTLVSGFPNSYVEGVQLYANYDNSILMKIKLYSLQFNSLAAINS